MFHSNSSSFNQRQPKVGPSTLPPSRFPRPMATSRKSSFSKSDVPLDRKIATNSRIEKDEKYKKDMYLTYVNNALLQKARGNNTPYDDLVKLFSSGQSQNSNVVTTTAQIRLCLSALSHVVSQLERTHSALVEAIVNLPWAAMDSFFAKYYTSFIGMLVSARPQYLSLVLQKIAISFTFRSVNYNTNAFISEDATPPVTRRTFYERYHNLLEYLFSLIPTLPASLHPLLVRNFPHKRQERADQETYIRNLLRITEYCPALTDRILGTIVDRIIQIDVEVQVEIDELEDSLGDEGIFVLDPFDAVVGQEGDDSDSDSNDEGALSDISSEAEADDEKASKMQPRRDTSHIRDMIVKLDTMMALLFQYFERTNKTYDDTDASDSKSHQLSHEMKKSFFIVLLSIFDRTIIRTFKSRYTQFLVFWYSSLDPEFTDMFQGMLVSKALLEENQPIVTRVAAASYIASFVSRALFVDANNTRIVVGLMCDYLEHHLDECAALGKDLDLNSTYHAVFYSVAQAVFLVFCFRWRDLQLEDAEPDELAVESVVAKKWVSKLDVLHRVVKSELNPLKICSQNVVRQFARVAHATNFLYCYVVMSTNQRMEHHNSEVNSPGRSHPNNNIASTIDKELNTFFPFDPYKLPLSSSYIQDIYREWSAVAIQDEEEDEDDEDSNAESEVEEAEDSGMLSSSYLPQSIPVRDNADMTVGGLSNSFNGMSISPVRPFSFTS